MEIGIVKVLEPDSYEHASTTTKSQLEITAIPEITPIGKAFGMHRYQLFLLGILSCHTSFGTAIVLYWTDSWVVMGTDSLMITDGVRSEGCKIDQSNGIVLYGRWPDPRSIRRLRRTEI